MTYFYAPLLFCAWMVFSIPAHAEKKPDSQILSSSRPKKTFITPSVKGTEYIRYYVTVRERIEACGTEYSPKIDGKPLYGELIAVIPIYHDGTIFEDEGGPSIGQSSGIAALDNAAIDTVRRAAPFPKIPNHLRTPGKADVWVVITRFKYTNDGETSNNADIVKCQDQKPDLPNEDKSPQRLN